jgi:hypothetical protein
MKVKDFIVFPSGTLIRKSSVIGIFAFEERGMLIVETDTGREYPVEIKAPRQFSAVLTSIAVQLNED